MSQNEDSSTKRIIKPRRIRVLILLAVLMSCLIVVVAWVVVFDSRITNARNQQLLAEKTVADLRYMAAMRAPAMPPVDAQPPATTIVREKVRPHLVRLLVEFDGFETRTATALAVEQVRGLVTYLITASESFAPVTGKLNGRMTTRKAGRIVIVDSQQAMMGGAPIGMPMSPGMMSGGASGFFPMMPGAPSAGPTVTICSETAGPGRIVLQTTYQLVSPIRIVGDFPKASTGDSLLVVAAGQGSEGPGDSLVTVKVLGIAESVTTAGGQQLDHLLKLTAWTGDPGAIVCNTRGEPIGQIIYTATGQESPAYSYAVPMDRVFAGFYEHHPSLEVGLRSVIKADDAQVGRLMPSSDGGVENRTTPVFAPDTLANGETPSSLPSAEVVGPNLDDPPADAQKPETRDSIATRIYSIQSNPTAVKTITELFESQAFTKIAHDGGSGSLVVIAPESVQTRVADVYDMLNERAKLLTLEEKKQQELNASVPDTKHPRDVNGSSNSPGAPSTGLPTQPTSIDAGDDREIIMDREARDLARRIRITSPAEQAALRKELEQVTERHFQYRQDHRKQELDDLSRRVDKLRTTHTRRQENKAEVIQRRLKELLDPNADLDWEPSPQESTSPRLAANPMRREPLPDPVPTDSTIGGLKKDDAGSPEQVAESTFDGIPYSQWLKMLGTERKYAKLLLALQACGELAEPKDARFITRKVFLAARMYEWPGHGILPVGQYQLWNTALATLNRLPGDAVVDELLVALRDQESFKEGREFQGKFVAETVSASMKQALAMRCDEVIGEFVRIASASDDHSAAWALAGACAVWQMTDRPINDFGNLSALVSEVIDNGNSKMPVLWKYGQACQRVMIALVAKTPERPGLALKLMERAQFLGGLSLVGKLGHYAEPAVPLIVDQFLAEWKTHEDEVKAGETGYPGQMMGGGGFQIELPLVQKIRILGEIGVGAKGYALLRQLSLIAPPDKDRDQFNKEVFNAVDQALKKFIPVAESDSIPFLLGDFWLMHGRWKLRLLAPGDTPKNYVATVNDREIQWSDEENPSRSPGVEAFVDIIAHKSSLEYEIVESKMPKQIKLTLKGHLALPMVGVYELTETTLRIQIVQLPLEGQLAPTEVVKDPKSLPKFHVLLEFDREMPKPIEAASDRPVPPQPKVGPKPANPVLDLSSNADSTSNLLKLTGAEPSPNKATEQTFDDIPYSHWLKLLESERKPASLAAAMEACGRLALPKDARSIARRIFTAAGLFEEGDQKEQRLVWEAGWAALNRLPGDSVVDEMLVALRDASSYRSGREFQGRYLAEKVSEAVLERFATRFDDVIAPLVKIASETNESSGWVLAGACAVWRETDRPIGDPQDFERLVFQMIDTRFTASVGAGYVPIRREWKIVVDAVVTRVPETSGLALKLMTFVPRNCDVLDFVVKMGRHAEPAVPVIVDQFVAEQTRYEDQRCNDLKITDPADRPKRSPDEFRSYQVRRVAFVKALGEIGLGAKGYQLLRQLNLTAPSRRDHNNPNRNNPIVLEYFEAVETSIKQFKTVPDVRSSTFQLRDYSLIEGDWKLRSLSPHDMPQKHIAKVRDGYFNYLNEQNFHAPLLDAKGESFNLSDRFEINDSKTPKQIELFRFDKDSRRLSGVYELTETTLRIQLASKGQPAPDEIAKTRDDLPEGNLLMEFDREMPKVPEAKSLQK